VNAQVDLPPSIAAPALDASETWAQLVTLPRAMGGFAAAKGPCLASDRQHSRHRLHRGGFPEAKLGDLGYRLLLRPRCFHG
jgi:hypothetical protein